MGASSHRRQGLLTIRQQVLDKDVSYTTNTKALDKIWASESTDKNPGVFFCCKLTVAVYNPAKVCSLCFTLAKIGNYSLKFRTHASHQEACIPVKRAAYNLHNAICQP